MTKSETRIRMQRSGCSLVMYDSAFGYSSFGCTRMPTETQEIETLANREYKWGFITDIEADAAPLGLNEEIDPLHLAQKGRAGWMLQWRLKAYRHWLTMEEPNWAERAMLSARSTIRSTIYYSAPKAKTRAWMKSIRSCSKTYEKLGIPLHERAHPRRRRGRCGVRQRLGRHDVQEASWPRRESSSARFGEAVREHPELVQKYMGSVVPYCDNYFATLNSRRLHRWLVRLHPQGREMPDGAEHVFPHQRQEHRASSSAR